MANDSEGLDISVQTKEQLCAVDRKEWGRWRLDPDTNCLTYSGNPDYPALTYEIPLEELETWAHAIRWIEHLEEKLWCSEEDLGHLVRAAFAIARHQSALGTSPAA